MKYNHFNEVNNQEEYENTDSNLSNFEAGALADGTVELESKDISISDISCDTSVINDYYSLSELVLPQDYIDSGGVKKITSTILVKRPDKQSFFRINPDQEYHMTVATIEVKSENEFYIVHPRLLKDYYGETTNKLLVSGVTRQLVPFVWPIGLPDNEGRYNQWHRSAREAAEHAKKKWIRLVPNRHLGAYETHEALGDLGDPEFLPLPMQEIINIAFKDKIIVDMDHPLIKQLEGLI